MNDNCRRCGTKALAMSLVLLAGMFCSCSHKTETQVVLPLALSDALSQLQELQTQSAKPLSPESTARIKHLESIVESEVRSHRQEIFQQQLSVLRAKLADAGLARQLGSAKPVFISKVNGDLFGAGGGAFELFSMMPLTLTPYLTTYIDREELGFIGHEKGALKVLRVSDDSCRTAIEYSKYVFVADFCTNGFKWCPKEVMLFKKP